MLILQVGRASCPVPFRLSKVSILQVNCFQGDWLMFGGLILFLAFLRHQPYGPCPAGEFARRGMHVQADEGGSIKHESLPCVWRGRHGLN